MTLSPFGWALLSCWALFWLWIAAYAYTRRRAPAYAARKPVPKAPEPDLTDLPADVQEWLDGHLRLAGTEPPKRDPVAALRSEFEIREEPAPAVPRRSLRITLDGETVVLPPPPEGTAVKAAPSLCYSVPCPACQARELEPCTQPTDNGRRVVTWVHVAREDQALAHHTEGSEQ